jgi:YD repeat-containing protein
VSHYASYDALGHVAKEWQAVSAAGVPAQTWFRQHHYDKLGHKTEMKDPSSVNFVQTAAGVVTTTMQYNAFGEITSRGVSGSTEHEYWEYDLAGRAWHTNEGGGVDKVYLYDRLGRRTSVLQSGGSGSGDKDVSTFTSASAAVANNTLRRTDYKYDALGHVVQEVQAARSESFSDVSVRNTTVGASVPEHGRYVIVTDNGQNSQTQWIPATISLSWPDLSALGDGALKIDVQYSEQQYAYDEGNAVVTESAEVQTSQFFRESSEAATGTTLTIVNPYTNDNPIGGVGSVKHVTISKLDAGGNWVTIADQAVPASTGNVIDVEKVEGFVSQDIQVLDKQTAGAAWTTIPKSLWLDFGAKYMVDLRSYDASRYQYRLVGTMPGGLQTVLFASDLSNTTSTYNGTTQTLRPTINYTVDRWGGVTSESDARNANWVTTYRYDKRGLIYQVITPDASGTGVFTSSVVHHDRLGRQVAVQDGNLHVNRQVLDGNGQVLEEVHADGGKVYNSYNGFGERTSTVDAVGNLTRFAYDKQGNLTDTDRYGYRNADGTTNGFAVYGVVRSGVDLELTSNTPTHQGYLREHNDWDTAGRLLAKTNAAGQTTRYRYDLRGNVVQTTKADGATNTYDAYDSRNRKVAEKDPNANTATWTYDALGQLASHTDIGGHTYTYGHDHARQLTAKTGGGQNVGYSYDAAGQLMRVIDNSAGGDGAALNKITTYQYDLAGHTIAERLTQGGEVYQDNYMAYDALGRLAWTGDTRANAIFTYDNAGNRTRAQTHEVNYDTTGGQANTNNSDRYYQYDAMNRQTLVDGDAAGNIGAKGHRLAYDKAGNRVSDTFVGKKVTTTTGSIINYDEGGGANYGGEVTYFTVQDGAEVTEAYKYDGAGHLISIERDGLQIDWRLYDAAGRAVQTGSNAQIDSTYYNLLYGNTTGNGSSIIRNQYDVNGQLKMQESWNSTATQKNQTIFFEKSNGTSGYDAAGNLTDYKVVVGFAQETISYSSTLELREGYLQKTTTAVSSKTGTGTSTNSYDANGAMASFTDAVKHENDKTFVANESGQVIATTQGTNVLRQMTVNGEVLGQYGGTLDKQNVANFQFGYRSVTPSYPNASPGTYVIQAGDTLRTIAQSAYGDANLWFEVADANSLRSDADLRVGQTLIVPSNIGGAHNDVSTFTPYDPSTIVGDTSPTLPMPQGHHGGCGGVGQILAIVIAVVATVLTAGAAAVALAAEGSALAGMGAMEAGLAIATGEAIGGLTAGVAMGAGAIGGAVGSIAGQVTSIATGNQHGFSWKQVGLSALGGGISAGVANELGASGALAGKSAPMAAARAAVANAATQGVAVATGQQHSFNWKATAASAVGAAVGQTIAPSLANAFGNTAAGQFAAQMTTRIVARSAGAAVSGDKVVLRQIAVDAFGNALGQGLVDSSRPTDNTQLPTGEFGRMDGEGSRSAPYDGGSAWSADVAARAQARRVQLEQYSADSPAYVGDSPAPNLPQAPVLVTLSPKQLQQMSQPQPAGALPEWDTQTVLVPGSYGGQIDSVEVLRGPSWLDAAHTRLDLGKLQITSRWGFLERADDFLERLQEPFAKYVTDRQDEGADAYARGDYWTAAKRAVGYLPDKVISDVAQGAIGTVRLATNNSMLPNLVRAVGSPLQTAQAMYNGFANMPLQDKVVTGLEVVGPMALKMTSPMAARAFGGTAVREFGSGGTLYTYGDHLKPVLGPATLSHPDELASILTRARDMGVGVRYEPGRLAYEPALRSGNPGTLILDPDASIGAVRHEWRHALDDAQLGHPGFGLMADSEAFWRLEYRGYMEEISLARQTRNFDVGRQIVDEMRARRSEILGY